MGEQYFRKIRLRADPGRPHRQGGTAAGGCAEQIPEQPCPDRQRGGFGAHLPDPVKLLPKEKKNMGKKTRLTQLGENL